MRNLAVIALLTGLVCALSQKICHGQQSTERPILKIGMQLPEMKLQMFNSSKETINLSEFKGKPMVLYLWATSCSSCVASFPKIKSLNEKYGDRIPILPVTYEPYKRINEFWANNIIAKSNKIPISIAATTLFDMGIRNKGWGLGFAYWIDANGIVRNITTGDFVNDKHLDAFLKGTILNWPEYSRKNRAEYNEPMLVNRIPDSQVMHQYNDMPIFYSSVSRYKLGFDRYGILEKDTIGKYLRWCYLNKSIPDLYLGFFRSIGVDYYKRHEIRMDSAKFVSSKQDFWEWEMKNTYCYEGVVPLSTSNFILLESGLQDLNRFLGMNARIEKRKMICLLLVKTGKLPRKKEGNKKDFLGDLKASLDNDPREIFDENGLSHLVDISVYHAGLSNYNFDSIKKFLNENGMDLVPAERTLDYLVITK